MQHFNAKVEIMKHKLNSKSQAGTTADSCKLLMVKCQATLLQTPLLAVRAFFLFVAVYIQVRYLISCQDAGL